MNKETMQVIGLGGTWLGISVLQILWFVGKYLLLFAIIFIVAYVAASLAIDNVMNSLIAEGFLRR